MYLHATRCYGLFSVPASLANRLVFQRGFFLRGAVKQGMNEWEFLFEGHRGARGLKPDNTLPSFEVALDQGVTSIETDIRLTADGVPVLAHDPRLASRRSAPLADRTGEGGEGPWIHRTPLAQLRNVSVDRNPDLERFPEQDALVTPAARGFAERQGIDPFGIPTLAEFFSFVAAYGKDIGTAGKTACQRERARRLIFDLELKRLPFAAGSESDSDLGLGSEDMEHRVTEAVNAANVADRTIVRSFDHRMVRTMRSIDPKIWGAVLIEGTVPIAPAQLAITADAQLYCPEYHFLDAATVRACHREGIRVVPWTVNDLDDAKRLLDWQVDGLTTDYPARLLPLLLERGLVAHDGGRAC